LAFELNASWEMQKTIILMTAESVRPLHALTLTSGTKGLNDTRNRLSLTYCVVEQHENPSHAVFHNTSSFK